MNPFTIDPTNRATLKKLIAEDEVTCLIGNVYVATATSDRDVKRASQLGTSPDWCSKPFSDLPLQCTVWRASTAYSPITIHLKVTQAPCTGCQDNPVARFRALYCQRSYRCRQHLSEVNLSLNIQQNLPNIFCQALYLVQAFTSARAPESGHSHFNQIYFWRQICNLSCTWIAWS